MLLRHIIPVCFVPLLIIASYLGSQNKATLSQSQEEPQIKYSPSSSQVRKYKPIKGAAKKKNPKRLTKKARPNDKLNSPDEIVIDENGVKIFSDGTNIHKDGTSVWADGTTIYPDGTTVYPDGTTIHSDGSVAAPDGTPVEIEQQILTPDQGASSQ